MGILNVTPDSFSDGGKYISPEKAFERALEIQNEGADILDIGAQSTRPGFNVISADQEWNRLEPVLKKLSEKITIPISIDTFYPEVAEKAIEYGADIINDVSGCQNDNMFKVAQNFSSGIIIVHSDPKNPDVKKFFESKLRIASDFGVQSSQICFDPGIGFNKTRNQDAELIMNLENVKIKDTAMLVGISKKRIIASLSENEKIENRLAGTVAVNTFAQLHGANILRVHDIKEAVSAAKAVDKLIKMGV